MAPTSSCFLIQRARASREVAFSVAGIRLNESSDKSATFALSSYSLVGHTATLFLRISLSTETDLSSFAPEQEQAHRVNNSNNNTAIIVRIFK
jgi:hypothetical protein